MSDAPSRAISHHGGLVFACPCRCYRDLTAWLGHPLDIRLVDLPSADGERHLALVEVDNARMLAAFYRAELGPWLRFLAAAAATNQRPEIPAIDTRDVEIVDGAQLQAQAAAAGSDPFVDLGAPFYVPRLHGGDRATPGHLPHQRTPRRRRRVSGGAAGRARGAASH